ncbi:MAG TPA: hypothetical protein DHR80_22480 [Thalassospira lucentensis]|uniref:Uncharacterized protein n=1 Tax=Thalassospira lucentensis TaxID=168935 RepID=A0A3D5NFJ7_9PROT|nr:hypothetical protein [Thalassospira lucentensis]HCW69920.1 hypothetical protein [Thalassospira lucentensis]|tara:strand:+ start:959 stop:1918 length:960 start_codon:yes stop_codon:yes gene_type:complete
MLIPYKTNYDGLLCAEHRSFHKNEEKKRRGRLLSEMRLVTGLPELIEKCNQDVLYKLVSPEGKLLQYDEATKTYRGVFYEGGRVSEHAKFKKISPNLLSSAKAVGSQVLLISIAMQLNEIQRMVENLGHEMHRDRIAEIEAGESQFRSALFVEDELTRKAGISNAIQNLHVGLKKTISELRVRIAEAPDPTNSIFDHLNPLKDKVKIAHKMMGMAQESFLAALRGMGVLSECYAALGEHTASKIALTRFIDDMSNCNIPLAYQKARLLEFDGPCAPQHPWRLFMDEEPVMRQKVLELEHSTVFPVEIEFMPHELLGGLE